MRMAAGIEGAGFWLPSEFLTDDDFLMDKDSFNNSDNNELHSDFCFPSEFPYHFETQPDHLLQKFCAMSASPQSTLANFGSAGGSNNGSPNGARTPLTMPMSAPYDAVGDLICLAAGEVAKLKLNRGYAVSSYPPLRNLAQFSHAAKIPTPSVYLNTKFENIGARAVREVNQVACPPHRIPTPGRAAFIGGGAATKKVCAGTGVFLPRRYENQNISHSNTCSSGPRRKPGCSASPFQGRASVQIHTKPYYDGTFRFVESQTQLQPRIGRAFISDLNMLARRHAVVLQQRRSFVTSLPEGSSTIGRDPPCLPREWTY